MNLLNLLTEEVAQRHLLDWYIIEWFDSLWGSNGVGTFLLIVIALILSLGLGALLGYQREINGHAAGFRTHILVSLSSALIMIISKYGLGPLSIEGSLVLAAAGIIGIGFLGAGTVVQNGITVKGLTTAATMWVTSAIGMACGAGLFSIAIIVTLVVLLTLTLLYRFEKRPNSKNVNILIIVDPSKPIMADILKTAARMEIPIRDVDTSLIKKNGADLLRITFRVRVLEKDLVTAFLDNLRVVIDPIEIKIL